MKKSVLLLSLYFFIILKLSIAQKTPIDFTTCKKWAFVDGAAITNNGLFVMFIIKNEPLEGQTLVIKPSNGKWEKKYPGASAGRFTKDSKFVSFIKSDGSGCLLNLQTGKEKAISNGENLPIASSHMEVYKEDSIRNKIIINSIYSNERDSIDNVEDYILTPKKNAIVFTTKKDKVSGKFLLLWYDLNTKEKKILLEGTAEQEIIFENEKINSNSILFKLKEAVIKENSLLSNVDIWSYEDAADATPFSNHGTQTEFKYAINCTGNRGIIQLSSKHERLESVNGDFALVQFNLSNNSFEASWNENARSSFYLVSLIDGSKKLVMKQASGKMILAIFTPNGKDIVLGDEETMQYYSYNIATANMKNISGNVQIYNTSIDMGIKFLPFNIIWVSDNSFIVNDDYDIWKLDVTGKIEPINLTQGYGRVNHIVFRLLQKPPRYSNSFLKISKDFNAYLLNAFDRKSKSWGMYKLLDLSGDLPVKLNMGQYYYGGDEPNIIRASDSKVYVVMRETAKESRNIFVTKDFIDFNRLSSVNPERGFNWMSTRLVKWKAYNDRMCDGILYKPEDFDSTKSYPVVVMIYNEFSDKMNKFINMDDGEFGGNNFLPISWLVSNGYLVFIPDVTLRKQGKRLQDSYNMVVSGVQHIKQFPYVDSNKIGLEGASWGGEQVNFIVTHTNIFAAAFTGSGYSERISDYGFVDMYKIRPGLMLDEVNLGGNFIEVPENYIKDAALFSADHISTPLLIKHNKDDGSVPFYQGFQFFNILRRLGKKVWMLQYENGGHGVSDGKDKEDMYLRISQFFDHFLKGKSTPLWMINEIDPDPKRLMAH